MSKNNDTMIGLRMTPSDMNEVTGLVNLGFAANPTDYVRRAMRLQIERDKKANLSDGPIVIANPSPEEI